ncbi:hypothetical protein JCM6882_009642 [Rhodosporidiobolus microsporus]
MSGYEGLSLAGGGGGGLPKRTRELQNDALLSSQLAPPTLSAPPPLLNLDSLHTVQEHTQPPSSLPPSLQFARRPRAGTLPSTFHLSSVPPRPLVNDSLLRPPLGSSGAASLPGSGPTTPLEHPFPSALIPPTAALAAPPHSRLRSGSLTLPSPSGLSSAFGPSVFSSGDWTPRSASEHRDSQPVASSSLSIGTTAMDDLKSPDGSTYGDDQHVRTLDYLGLAEEHPTSSGGGFDAASEGLSGATSSSSLAPPVAPPMHRLGSTGSIQPAPSPFGDFSAHHSRLRSNTVAAFPRAASAGDSLLRSSYRPPSASISYPSSAVGGPTSVTSAPPSDDMRSSTGSSNSFNQHHRSTPSADSARLLYATAAALPSPGDEHAPAPGAPLVGLRPPGESASSATGAGTNGHDLPHRGRAATIGILDEGKDVFPRRRAGTTVGIPPRHLGVGAAEGGGGGNLAGRMGRLSISEDAPVWPGTSRPLTPEGAVSLTPPLQQPTRSLWVGNLDPKTTPAELQAVFAPYGAIESLRLIPEKECGFVNFVSVADAMHAKEDVLNRLGGQLTKTSGLVRIGYGKAESTPAPTAPGLVHPRSTAAGGTILTSSADLNLQTQPTRALWIGSIPSTTTPNHLLAIFSSFGPIESARVLTHKSCGFVNFERLDDAVSARKALNGRELLGAEVGAVRIGYAKVPTKVVNGPFANHLNGDGTPASTASGNGTAGVLPPPPLGSYQQVYGALQQLSGVSGVLVERQMADGQVQDYRSNMLLGVVSNGHYANAHAFATGAQQAMQQQQMGSQGAAGAGAGGSGGGSPLGQPGETIKGSVNEMQLLMRELSVGDPEVEEHVAAVANDREPSSYYTSVPLAVMTDPRWARRYSQNDAPRLREMRKRLDGEISVAEVDTMAYDLLDEVVPLASDFIGNTIVQKLFEQCSTPVRKTMLERIAPHLAPIGTHKNGTWAVQKIIQCAQDEDEYALIEQNLRPYTPPLLLNDFGNYVVQGALRFSSPYSDFIFDAMVERIWEIGSGRFGARSTRQTLENPQSPRVHVKRVASSIVLNAIPLATSSNGALLVTWFLELSNLPQRYALLAPRFAPHLSHLFTHKLASQSVMRVINQREDAEAQRILLDALLDPEAKVLEDILGDQMHGVSAITKVIASTYLSAERREQLYERVQEAVEALKVSAVPAYRKLIEDVGGRYSGPPPGNTPPFTPGASHSPHMRGPSTSPSQQFSSGGFAATPGRRPPPPHQQQHGSPPYYPPPPPMPFPPPSAYGAPPMPYPGSYGPPPPGPGYPLYPYFGQGGPPPFSPPFGPATSPGGGMSGRGGPPTSSPGVSPLVQHASAPGLGGGPFSPTAIPPSISSPDFLSSLRVTTGDAGQSFYPLFSPGALASPPPPPFFGQQQSFGMQQQQPTMEGQMGQPSFGDFSQTNGH